MKKRNVADQLPCFYFPTRGVCGTNDTRKCIQIVSKNVKKDFFTLRLSFDETLIRVVLISCNLS